VSIEGVLQCEKLFRRPDRASTWFSPASADPWQVSDPLAVVDTSVERDVDGEGQESHGEDSMMTLPPAFAPPAAGIQLQFGPRG